MKIQPEVAAFVGDIDFDPDALSRKIPERARQAHARGRHRPVCRGEGASSPATSTTPMSSRASPARRCSTRCEFAIIGGGFGGLLMGARLREAGFEGSAHGRERRRLRRHLVLEPLSRRDVRRGILLLPAAARRARLHAEAQIFVRAGDPRAQPAHRAALPSLRQRAAADGDHRAALGRGRRALDHQHQPRRPIQGAVCGDGERPAEPAEAARHSRHQRVQGLHVSHQPLGLSLHRRRQLRQSRSSLKDKRVGIIGTGATAIQCIPHLGEAAKQLYVFQRTPSSIDVRNNARPILAWAATLEPGWQKRRMENFNILVSGGDQDEDLVARRLDRHLPQPDRQRPWPRRRRKLGRRLTERGARASSWCSPTTGR